MSTFWGEYKMAKTKEDKEIIGNYDRFVIKKAEHNKEIEIAKKLIKMSLEISKISEATGLTKEEIEKIKRSDNMRLYDVILKDNVHIAALL